MRKKKWVIFLLVNVFLWGSLYPAEQEKPEPFFKALWQDEKEIWTSPFKIKGKDWLLWGGTILVTGILIANDESIYRRIKAYQGKHEWVDEVSPKITKLGLGEWNIGIAGAFYLGGLLFKDKKARETGKLVLMTFIHTGVVAQVGKHLLGRQRPSWEDGKDRWHGPAGFFKRYEEGQLPKYDAFPSGHMLSIMGTATVISEMYKKTVVVPVVCYSLAALCGISRVTEDTHWLSEIFFSAVVGYAIGKFVVKRRNRLRRWQVYPTARSDSIGVGLSYIF